MRPCHMSLGAQPRRLWPAAVMAFVAGLLAPPIVAAKISNTFPPQQLLAVGWSDVSGGESVQRYIERFADLLQSNNRGLYGRWRHLLLSRCRSIPSLQKMLSSKIATLLKGHTSRYLRAVHSRASVIGASDTLGPTASTKSRANGGETRIIASRTGGSACLSERLGMSAGVVEITWPPVLSSRGSDIWSMARQESDVLSSLGESHADRTTCSGVGTHRVPRSRC
jgi:hypothetical protein